MCVLYKSRKSCSGEVHFIYEAFDKYRIGFSMHGAHTSRPEVQKMLKGVCNSIPSTG